MVRQALLVTERELKMWQLLTSSENDFYMCLPKGNNMKIENGSTNCYVPAALVHNKIGSKSPVADTITAAGKDQEQLKEEVVVAVGEQQKFNHVSANNRLYMSLYKASVCDKIVQMAQQWRRNNDNDHLHEDTDQLKLYLHDSSSSICGKEDVDQNEQVKRYIFQVAPEVKDAMLCSVDL